MAKKEFLFYGKKLDELKEMTLADFASILTSRSKRTVMRRQEEIKKFEQRVLKKNSEGKKLIKTHKRNMIITPKIVGLTIGIYNGKEYIQVEIKEQMLGHYLGEFSLTRRRLKHGSAGVGATRSSASVKSK